MRVLYATDGSREAQVVIDLITSLRWPEGTKVRVICAVDCGSVFLGAPLSPAVPANADEQEQELRDDSASVVSDAARRLSAKGLAVECITVDGRVASVIIDDAAEWHADLIVMGSRGHGEIASMVLGSVSSEVADHAPCPVLVARRPTLRRVLLAHDGSAHAMRAEELVATSPIFADADIEVVIVAPAGPPWAAALAPSMYDGNMDVLAESTQQVVADDTQLVDAAARRLRAAGRRVTSSVAEGAPATELIRVADERAADAIVIGTRGQTGLRRLMVGSVARNVMQHAHCSVLIVR